MASLGEQEAEAGFIHPALLYGSDREFMAVALPFVEEGLGRGEPILAAVQSRNADNLRSALGGEQQGLTLLSVEEWFGTSAGTREKFARWVLERTEAGRVRLIGEPPWAVGKKAQVRDWARHESVINTAFEGLPVTFICPYDARVLPGEIIEHARCTHPEIAGEDGWRESESYEDPLEFCGRLDERVEQPTGMPSIDLGFGLADLPRMRQVVRSAAAGAGLEESRAEELALAVNEIATNALVHGRLPARLRIWLRELEIVCEVADSGAGIDDVLAGQLTPPAHGLGGRGLWLARLICDAVEIRNGSGCSVTLRAAVPRTRMLVPV